MTREQPLRFGFGEREQIGRPRRGCRQRGDRLRPALRQTRQDLVAQEISIVRRVGIARIINPIHILLTCVIN